MDKNCSNCGNLCKEEDAFCGLCGFKFETQDCSILPENETEVENFIELDTEESNVSSQENIEAEVVEEEITIVEEPGKEQSPKDKKRQKEKKKKSKLRKFLKFMFIFISILIILFALWFTLGKWLTLYIHSNQVVDSLNAGSLNFPGAPGHDYEELPDYAKELLGEEYKKEQENGPLLNAVLPYLKVERVEIEWFRSDASIEYSISAPDVEYWIKNLSKEQISKGQEEILKDLETYLIIAERREKKVTIEYKRDGIFSIDWSGDYETIEFADAISGGVNTAYNELYEQALDELEEMLK